MLAGSRALFCDPRQKISNNRDENATRNVCGVKRVGVVGEQDSGLLTNLDNKGFRVIERLPTIGEEVEPEKSDRVLPDLFSGAIVIKIEGAIQQIESLSSREAVERRVLQRPKTLQHGLKLEFGHVEHARGLVDVAESLPSEPEAHAAENTPAFVWNRLVMALDGEYVPVPDEHSSTA